MKIQRVFVSIYSIVKYLSIKSFYVLLFNLFVIFIVWFMFLFNSIFEFKTKKKTISTSVSIDENEKYLLESNGFHLRKEEIGSGYYGTVYKSYHMTTDPQSRVVSMAIKVIDVEKFHQILISINKTDKEFLKTTFNKSFDILEKVENKRIVKIIKTMKTFNKYNEIKKIFLFSETAEMNLNDFLKEYKPNGLEKDWARLWFRHICEAVHCLHNVYKVFHHNIKPENILLFTRNQNEINVCQIKENNNNFKIIL